MCGCDYGFVCSRCMPLVEGDDGEWSEAEVEQWRRSEAESTPDFLKPMGGAA